MDISWAERWNNFNAKKHNTNLSKYEFKMLKLLKKMAPELREEVIRVWDKHWRYNQIWMYVAMIAIFGLGAILGGAIGYAICEIKWLIQNLENIIP